MDVCSVNVRKKLKNEKNLTSNLFDGITSKFNVYGDLDIFCLNDGNENETTLFSIEEIHFFYIYSYNPTVRV